MPLENRIIHDTLFQKTSFSQCIPCLKIFTAKCTFSNRTAFRLSDYYIWTLSECVNYNFRPCDWSDCPKACLSLVETGSNVSEEEQVLGSRGECYLQYKSTQTGFDR